MSLGSIIGGVAGGIVGFFIGGPMGAVYGASIGFGIGALVDPMTPDIPSSGAPAPESGEVMTSTVGDPCPDVIGTGKIVGHLLFYGGERSEAIYSDPGVSGGKGGAPEPEPQVAGYNYYMSWVLGICAGPVDTLYSIFKNKDLVWEGPLDIPASGGQETIVIEGMGSVTFYFGTSDQVANTTLGALLSDDTLNTPYRNYCWAFFDDCLIGNYPRTPSMSFVVKKIPTDLAAAKSEIQDYDSNPMHAEYYILNKLVGMPTDWLDSADFSSVASTLFFEFRGMSIVLKNQQSALDYIQSINYHVDNILRYGSDGKFHPKLIRNDYDTDTITSINEDDMLDDPSLIRKSWIDTINEVKVQYTEIIAEREKNVYGTLYGVGINTSNQLGPDVSPLGENAFVIIPSMSSVKLVKAFTRLTSSVCLDTSGKVWCCGDNAYGQFALGNDSDPADFTEASGTWADVIPGDQAVNIAYMTSSGGLWGCGYNYNGQLGLDDATDPYPRHIFTPQQEALGLSWSSVILGTSYSIGVSSEGRIYVTGSSIYVLGYSGGSFYKFTEDAAELTGWTEVYAAGGTVFARRNGIWYACGYNGYGELGAGLTGSNYTGWQTLTGGLGSLFTKIRIGHSSGALAHGKNSVALGSDGTIWTCGYNGQGQLGQGDTLDRNYWVQVGTETNWVDIGAHMNSIWALNDEGEVWGCGRASSSYGSYWGLNPPTQETTLHKETANNSWFFFGGGYASGASLALK